MMQWVLATIIVLCVGCAEQQIQPLPDIYPSVPSNFPPLPVPRDNPITPAKAALGKTLFFERRLSSDGTTACASCHLPSRSFSDAPNQVSRGVGGALGQRNAPTLINVAYRTTLFWDGRASTLEDQAKSAFMHSAEMDADTVAVAALLRSAEYRGQWIAAFGDTAVTMRRTMQAIATFERTIVSANSRYDKFVRGDRSALTHIEREGMDLFFSSRSMCSSCHNGPDFTNDQFQNIGLFHHYFDRGRFNVTREPRDEGLFKTPTLRNVALTAPYMATGDSQAGLMSTLEDVVEHYNEGGTAFPNKDKRVAPLNLTDREKLALVAFMRALTDSSVLTNPAWIQP
jgi:cytochrome c peroxidase